MIEQGVYAGKGSAQRLGWLVVAGIAILGIGVALSLALGARSIPFSDVLAALRGQPGIASSIVWERRLPRTRCRVCGLCFGSRWRSPADYDSQPVGRYRSLRHQRWR